MTMKIPSVPGYQIPNAFIRWHFDALSHNPALAHTLISGLAIPEEVFSEDGKALSANRYAELLSRTIIALDDESFGTLARPLRRGSFHMMCHAAIGCTTLGATVARCIRFYRLMNDQIRWRLESDGEWAELHLDLADVDAESGSYFYAFLTCILWRWLSWTVDDDLEIARVDFMFAAPDCAEEIRDIFKDRVEFGQPATRIRFSSAYLNRPVRQTPRTLEMFLIKVPECLLSHYRTDMRLGKRLRDYLQAMPALNEVTLAMAAEYFCCSEQTLIRGLRAEHTRFKTIKDEIQKRRAHTLMLTSGLSNQEISRELGFSEPSVFYRSVKNWFGQTPNQYRQSVAEAE